MNVWKVINNNIVLSRNDDDQEVVIMGKGLGFKKKAGDAIDESKIENMYLSSKEWSVNKLTQMLSSIPLEHIQVANEIISFAKVSLGKKLSENIFLTLTDHISYAIERYENGMEIKNALLWEIKRFYNHEFLIGKEALSIVKNRLGVDLPEDEAGFIALHIVNAELDMGQVSKVSEMAKVIQNILNIVKYHFKIDLDEYSLNYERFITHLKFFFQRMFSGVKLDDAGTSSFIFMLKEKYTDEYACALKIREYIKKEFGRELEEDELIYLTIHIKRITSD
ncbi:MULTISPECIES: BglG family transcription antiterminator LicT [Niallia]|jgi:beta-glucoside operon transcriptional antiterminator|uniref:Transcription antiterminator BglG n=1 Tax=Niallia circulans TaxID=1397 RepID=A0A268F5W2_NIACI|nr:PRD domain-containing protein [Niallia circulans]AYV69588.1 PRD domain-containing protein [Niallia circulans]AYV72021.1 PRD domain-containing protein [Niallia circulans]NRG25868.1 PRD domain-containing protein [Niallia circulans]PAD80771.1 transcription antiterminator BglG [Niallia circulans]QJX61078.1 PRD domain-containing protein [Niallia circulans]